MPISATRAAAAFARQLRIEPADADNRPRELAAQMHLLEAFQALHQATGESAWLARAQEMVGFIRDRLIDRETGSLGELYTADWQPRAGIEGEIREPGDNFEVAWMLYGHARLTGDARARVAADRLYEFSLRHGVDSAAGSLPAAFAQVTRRGQVVKDAKPLWAQTELVKAALGRLEATRGSGGGRACPVPSRGSSSATTSSTAGGCGATNSPATAATPASPSPHACSIICCSASPRPCASGPSFRHGMYDKFTSAVDRPGRLV